MRVDSLTFLRFIAAAIVVVNHFGRDTEFAKLATPFLVSGAQMVTFFFVLSGFVMMLSHYDRKDDSVRKYYFARIARIFPAYAVALGISCIFAYGRGSDGIVGLLLSVTFLQAWISPYPLVLNRPAWSVSVEAFFYLIFPLFLLIAKGGRVTPKTFLAASVLFWVLTQVVLSVVINSDFHSPYPSLSHDLVYFLPLSHLCSFLLGAAGGYLFMRSAPIQRNSGMGSFVLMLSMFAMVFLVIQYRVEINRFLGFRVATGSSFLAPFFLALILSVSYSKNVVTKALATKPFTILGDASYALYILQWPLYIAYTKYVSSHLDLGPDATFHVFFALLVCASVVSLYAIERPGKRLILSVLNFGTPRNR